MRSLLATAALWLGLNAAALAALTPAELGVVVNARDRSAARSYWQQVVDTAQPTLVEYAAARNELARSAS